MQIIQTIICFSAVPLLLGQQASNVSPSLGKPQAVQAKREPAPASTTSLNSESAVPSQEGSDPFVNPEEVPKEYQPRVEVPLNATAQEAVRVSERWRAETNSPAAGSDGRVLYSFGAGLPTVVCAPLRVCMIELQEGEKIVGEPQIGDSVRWNISPALYGTGDRATAVIVLKPQIAGLDTNLLVTTDRRAYYLRLISKVDDYVARIAFAYPDDDKSRKWKEQIAKQSAGENHAPGVMPAIIAVEKMNFAYTIKGGDEHIRPLRVFDDGAKTYIQMPTEIQHREAPVLLVLGTDGKGEMTNYRVRDQMYIVDRLFDRANLVLGAGKRAQKVGISRGEPKG